MIEMPSERDAYGSMANTSPRLQYIKKGGKEAKELILGLYSTFNFNPGSIGTATTMELQELHTDTSGSLISALPVITYANAKKAWTYLNETNTKNDATDGNTATPLPTFELETNDSKESEEPEEPNEPEEEKVQENAVALQAPIRRRLYRLVTKLLHDKKENDKLRLLAPAVQYPAVTDRCQKTSKCLIQDVMLNPTRLKSWLNLGLVVSEQSRALLESDYVQRMIKYPPVRWSTYDAEDKTRQGKSTTAATAATAATAVTATSASGSSGTSQEWIKNGALVNILETANVEPGLGKIWKIHHVSSFSDVVKFVDIKRISNRRLLKTINSTG
jgi:hypothetical protein